MKSDEEQEAKPDSQSRMIKGNDEAVCSRGEKEEHSHRPVEKGHGLKVTKQATLDAKFFVTKVTSSENDRNAAKRKRESSDEREDSMRTRKSADLRVNINSLSNVIILYQVTLRQFLCCF